MITNSLNVIFNQLLRWIVISVIPVIKEKPKVIKIIKKKTVIVECHVLSKFSPECTWLKENQPVKEDKRHKVHVEQVKEVSPVSL